MKSFKGIIFDLDGTVVNSNLNFDLMREEIGITNGSPILEYIDTLIDPNEIRRAFEIVHRHEMNGALGSELIRDFLSFYEDLKSSTVPMGILTRNSKEVTSITLKKHFLEFDEVLTRDCCKAKPDPEGLILISKKWNIPTEELIYVGDFKFDLDTARNANMKSALILNDKNTSFVSYADYSFKKFNELKDFFI